MWWFQVIVDLEEEKRKHAEDTAEGDDVTYILEKERERLLQQVQRTENTILKLYIYYLNLRYHRLQFLLL